MLAGIIILMIGILYFLELLIPEFVIDYSIIWPLVMVVCASYFIIKKGKFDFGNSLLLFVGIWWFSLNIGIIPDGIRNYFWPLLLIFIGGCIVWGSVGFEKKIKKILRHDKDETGFLNYYGIFGGVREKVKTEDFVGANIYSIFGGCELNLKEIEIKNESAIIYVYSIFGGSELFLPHDKFDIVYNSTAIFGGDENTTVGDPKAKKKLYINCVSVFGGSQLK